MILLREVLLVVMTKIITAEAPQDRSPLKKLNQEDQSLLERQKYSLANLFLPLQSLPRYVMAVIED